MPVEIYNLEFPSFVNELALHGYTFRRVRDYGTRVQQLQHLDTFIDEFRFQANSGTHAVTAEVTTPAPQPASLLEWGNASATHLDDILLMLSLFTLRHVWAQAEPEIGVIVSDHRVYHYGRLLRQGLPHIWQEEGDGRVDVAFEAGINSVLDYISDQAWRNRYRGGHYLFLANQAFRRQIVETQFSLCFTIWEHLFALYNDQWMNRNSIHRLSGEEKISFIRSVYGITDNEGPPSQMVVDIRNRLVHFGKFPNPESIDEADRFIRLTELLIARTLGLYQTHSPFSV